MTFVHGGLALAGLIAVAIPIIIHLLSRRRRRPIEWAAMRFLLEAFRKQKRRLQVEQLLLLLVRCLILAVLGAALARPLMERAGMIDLGGSRAIYLVIDNGLAAQVVGADGRTALEQHLEQAAGVIGMLKPGDAVAVVSGARPARAVLAPPTNRHGAALEMIESIEPAAARSELGGALGEVRRSIDTIRDEYDQILVYLLSEFRDGSAPLESSLPTVLTDLGDRVRLLASTPASTSITNIQIAAVDPIRSLVLPEAGDGSGQVTVRLTRHGGELAAAVSRVRLTGEGVAPVEPRIVTWQPGQSEADVEFLLRFGTGRDRKIGLTATIEADALAGDNTRHTVLELRNRLRVVLIDRRSFGFQPSIDRLQAGQWIGRALEPAEGTPVQVVQVEPAALDPADVRAADVAMVPRPDLLADSGWTILREFVDRGGLLVVMPPGELNVHPWVDHLQTDLDLPWRISPEAITPDVPLAFADEQPDGALFRMIAAELAELVRPVRVARLLPVDTQQSQGTPILELEDGTPLLLLDPPRPSADLETDAAPSLGLVAYLAVAPELSWTNLPGKPLMVPLFHELVRQGASLSRFADTIHVGDRPVIGYGSSFGELVAPDGERVALGGSGRPHVELLQAGLHQLRDRADQPLGTFAVNIEPGSARTATQSRQEVQRWLRAAGPWDMVEDDELTGLLRSARAGSPLAGVLLVILLGLVVLETALARWFSHAHRPALSRGPERWQHTIGETAGGAGVRGAAS